MALAAALAAMAGYEKRLTRRSLLTAKEGAVCVQIRVPGSTIANQGKAWSARRD